LKIVFLCGCLEPGRDGVGDYSRRLAAEIIRQGHQAAIIALNDSYVNAEIVPAEASRDLIAKDFQESDGTEVPVMRLSQKSPWSVRTQIAKKYIESKNPDWISLQFVPYSFHSKGLPFMLSSRLKALGERHKWHIMFHELCVGLQEASSLKERVIGFAQQATICSLVRRLCPSKVHSNCEPYINVLRRWEIPATQLRLFSNLMVSSEDGYALLTNYATNLPPKERLLIGGAFGAIYSAWAVEEAINEFFKVATQRNKQALFVLIGKHNRSDDWLQDLIEQFRGRVNIISTGQQPDFVVSRFLNSLDVGFVASPRGLIEKSGAAAAFRDHGIPLVVSRDDWKLRGYVDVDFKSEGIYRTVEEALCSSRKLRCNNNLTKVTQQFIDDLNNSHGSDEN
jgi:hypothetical protein